MFFTAVTNDREALAHAVAPRLELDPDEILEMPHFLIGTVEQITEDIQARRERFGLSFIVVQGEAAEDLAPVVQRLAGT
jgi:alkanesulfonate monooxygenase SsuD/methylene tetrahydromethanopterin reductase-like flavin-dependent oxidoreductase (luciferase family)